MKFLLTIFIPILFFSCSNDNSQNAIAVIDSLAKKDSIKKEQAKVSEDSIKHIDSTVAEIRKKIENGSLRKKVMMDGVMSHEGIIYELYDKDNSLVYAYSDNGMEFGAEELECFFQNEVPVFSIVNRIKFGIVAGESNSSIRNKTATQKTYFSNGKILQQKTETFTNEKGWQKIPFENKLQEIIKDIDADLNRNGEWVKK